MLKIQDSLKGKFGEMRSQEEDEEGTQRIAESGLGPNVQWIITEENIMEQRLPRAWGSLSVRLSKRLDD